MKKQLSEIIKSQGIQYIQDSHQLAEQLAAQGADKKKALILELILQSCPSIYETILQGEVTWAEGNALISSVVRSTSLSPYQVRKILGELFQVCGTKIPPVPYGMGIAGKKKVFHGTVSLEEEDEQFRIVWQRLNENSGNTSAVLSVLEGMSQAGNVYANYQLGEYYRKQNGEGDRERAIAYYKAAAEGGYGPAYGALAYYEMYGEHRNLRNAANYFMHPAALADQDGKNWADNAMQLQRYRGENKERNILVGKLSLLTVILSLLFTALTGFYWAVLSVILGCVGIGLSLFNRLFAQYHSPRGIYSILLVSWFLMVFGLL